MPDEAARLGEDERLIRQFLRGDPDGPISDRRSEADYERALFGSVGSDSLLPTPSLEPTR
jgi:hypothetical protein